MAARPIRGGGSSNSLGMSRRRRSQATICETISGQSRLSARTGHPPAAPAPSGGREFVAGVAETNAARMAGAIQLGLDRSGGGAHDSGAFVAMAVRRRPGTAGPTVGATHPRDRGAPKNAAAVGGPRVYVFSGITSAARLACSPTAHDLGWQRSNLMLDGDVMRMRAPRS